MTTETWPGAEQRGARRSSITYTVRAPLVRWLQQEAARAAADMGSYRVLDVGCGIKPYYPFFAQHASEYVGVDVVPGPQVDLIGGVEQLPVADASFDLVICTQVLEHVDDPGLAVRELRRVTAPGGRVLASTHGVQVYHPSPNDLWRWTHAGLGRLFADNGEWGSVSVQPSSGTTSCLTMLLGIYIDLILRKARLPLASRGAVWALNGLGAAVDARSATLRGVGPGTLHANYHVVAEAPGAAAPGAEAAR